ncbi:MAG: putative metalloprotease CJM1_0395 family protein [Candidatus Muiribacteriota bacterium]
MNISTDSIQKTEQSFYVIKPVNPSENNTEQKKIQNISENQNNLFEDSVEISEEAYKKSAESENPENENVSEPQNDEKTEEENKPEPKTQEEIEETLTQDQKAELEKLKQTDMEVKQHEAAHIAAAGGLQVSGASFEFKTGPDGKQYAIGGEVSIDTSKGSTPDETIAKAKQIRTAALAPSNPSSQDLKVASQASKMEMEAAQQKQTEQKEELENTESETSDNSENNTKTNNNIQNIYNSDFSTRQYSKGHNIDYVA